MQTSLLFITEKSSSLEDSEMVMMSFLFCNCDSPRVFLFPLHLKIVGLSVQASTTSVHSISLVFQKVIRKLEYVKQLRKTWERKEHKRAKDWKYKRVLSKIYVI